MITTTKKAAPAILATAAITTRCPRGTSYADWADRWSRLLSNRQPLATSGALRGTRTLTGSVGWLVGYDLLAYECDKPLIDYVVYSYDTPIAWHVTEEIDGHTIGCWVVVGQKFSCTTSKHQSLIRRFITA